ncbi:unnamed protein product, partial [Rodentolepis nana]|uniref:SET domain-containing protein n=1 Tax=Rodentolepis nana TaxID=102285 RepID=A0A0R3TQT6_RODNA
RRLSGDYEFKDPKSPEEIIVSVTVYFKDKDGGVKKVAGKVGDNLMYLAHRYRVDIEGACEASCACSTCHVFVKDEFFDKLPDAADEENDMLDQAPFLKPNSRLACQIILAKELDGIELMLSNQTDDRYKACRIWEQILTTESDFIQSSGDHLELFKSAKSPSVYYSRILNYTKCGNTSQSLNNLHKLISDLHNEAVYCKSSQKAGALREEGNAYFRLGESYRKGLLVAPQKSKEFALLHGNLSAALLHQSKWAACVWHTCLALKYLKENDAPINRRLNLRLGEALEKLHKRDLIGLNNCYEWISHCRNEEFEDNEQEERYGVVNVPKPKYGRGDPKAFSSQLIVKESPEKGRYVISKGNFTAGDVLASEPAGGWHGGDFTDSEISREELAVSSCILLPFQRHNRCFACHNHLESIGYICLDCNDAAFCGPPSICFSKHFKGDHFEIPQWHRDECRFIFLLNSIGLGHLCYRLGTLRGRKILRTDGDVSIDNLVDNFQFFPSNFEYALTGWLCGLLMEKMGLPNAGEWCFGMLRRLQCNAHALTEVSVESSEGGDLSGIVQERIGGGLFPAVSLINHACEPNITYQFLNGFIVIRCIKDLKPGDEILACYGPHYLRHPDSELRRKALNEQYFFNCNCRHCCREENKPVEMSSETTEEWNKLVDQVRDENTLISKYKPLFGRLKTLSSMKSFGNFQPSYGEIADEIAQRLLNQTLATASFRESREIVIYLVNESTEYVRKRFGVNSTEYAWELVKMLSVDKAFGLASKAEAKASVRRIITIHYGQREAKKILSCEKLRDIFE